MIYNWDINAWVYNEMPTELKAGATPGVNDTNVSWVKVFLSPVRYLYSAFMTYQAVTFKKMRYNGQTIILRNLLNDLFDPIHRRIIITTSADVLPRVFYFLQAEQQPDYYYTKAEYLANPALVREYLYTINEYGNRYDFIVQAAAGSLSAAQIVRLKATVNYYRVAGKIPHYQYDNLNPF